MLKRLRMVCWISPFPFNSLSVGFFCCFHKLLLGAFPFHACAFFNAFFLFLLSTKALRFIFRAVLLPSLFFFLLTTLAACYENMLAQKLFVDILRPFYRGGFARAFFLFWSTEAEASRRFSSYVRIHFPHPWEKRRAERTFLKTKTWYTKRSPPRVPFPNRFFCFLICFILRSSPAHFFQFSDVLMFSVSYMFFVYDSLFFRPANRAYRFLCRRPRYALRNPPTISAPFQAFANRNMICRKVNWVKSIYYSYV